MNSGRANTMVIALSWLAWAAISPATHAADPQPRPVDELMRLVPPDAAVVLSVEGLRDHVRRFRESPLADSVMRLPAVRAWFDSDTYRQLERSQVMIETVLETKLTEIRDELLGDAVIMALRLPTELKADPGKDARGLVLLRARDERLLTRVVAAINKAQQESGELEQLVEHTWSGATYQSRIFPAADGRPPEWYAHFADGTFAFSNAESLIRSVIDRKTSAIAAAAESAISRTSNPSAGKIGPGLGDLPQVKSVASRLPGPALARLFVDPRQVERLIALAPRSDKPADLKVLGMLGRFLAAVNYAGASLVWNEQTLVVHAIETLDATKLDPWIGRTSRDTRPLDPALGRVPPTAVAVASAHIDALALFEAISLIVPDQAKPRLTQIKTVLTGLLLGQDLETRVLPAIGPGLFGYLDSPDSPPSLAPEGRGPWLFPPVIIFGLEARKTAADSTGVPVASAIENAVKTVLALMTLDENRAQGKSQVVTRSVAGASVMTLDPPIPFAFAVDQVGRRLVVGTTTASVAHYLEKSADPTGADRFQRFRTANFPEAESYLCVDVEAMLSLATRHRDTLTQTLALRQNRPLADASADLAQVMDLAQLFQAAFLSTRLHAGGSAAQQSLGLILRNPHAH